MTKVNDVIGSAQASSIMRFQPERRSFIRNLGIGAAGAATLGAGAIVSTGASAGLDADGLDAAILNFALNLEYLEAEFYLRAAFGRGLNAADIGANPGTVTGGSKVKFSSALNLAYAQEIALEEEKHVQFLRAALMADGRTPVSRPNIDLKNSFVTLGQASGVSTDFNPFANDTSFLLGSYVFEDVGVTAYHGAAPLITNKTYLDKAAGILAVEAYHAGIIRTVLFADNQAKATAAISALRAMLDGTEQANGQPVAGMTIDDYGVGTTGTATGSTLAVVDGNAIAFDRTTRQVLNIVYGAPNRTRGLFFPNGVNGYINGTIGH